MVTWITVVILELIHAQRSGLEPLGTPFGGRPQGKVAGEGALGITSGTDAFISTKTNGASLRCQNRGDQRFIIKVNSG